MSRTIGEICLDDITQQFINRPVNVYIELMNEKEINIQYEGSFLDVLGFTIDLIQEIIKQYDIDSKIIIYMIGCSMNKFIDEFVNKMNTPPIGHALINIAMDKKQMAKGMIEGNPRDVIFAFKKFITKLSEDYDFSIEEYMEVVLQINNK